MSTTATLPAAGGDSAAPSVKNSKRSVKSATKSTTAKTLPQHPSYKEMVSAAVAALKDRKGASRHSVSKYIKTNYKVKDNCDLFVNGALVKGVTSGTLVRTIGKGAAGRFKLAKVEKKPVKKVTKVAAKKPIVKKVAKKAIKPQKAAAGKAKKTAVKKVMKKVVKKKTALKRTPAKSARAAKPQPKKAATKKPAKKAAPKRK